jgi:uncharacterized protein involved in exopolysaccharide biosynthesis
VSRAPHDALAGGGDRPGLVDDAPDAAGPDLRLLARAAWARRGLVSACALGGAGLLLAIAFVLPSQFVADISLLEAPRPGGSSALDQLGLSAQVLGIKSGGGPTNALTYPDILRSRRLVEGLLAARVPLRDGRRVLLEEYLMRGPASPQRTDRAVQKLRERFDIALDRRTNLLRLGVTDHDPVLAAAVANAAATMLQDLVMRSLMTQAGANRRFVETRLAQARIELARAEDALERFRENNRHPDAPRLLMDQGRLVRDLRTREEVLVALTREYEMARVDENRDVPVLNVLDVAQPPAFRASPRRATMTAAGLLLGLVTGLALAWSRREREVAAEVRAEAA